MPAPVYKKVTTRTCGVYAIICVPTGQRYIGASVKVVRRWIEHKYDLAKGKHRNFNLQEAWNRFGPSSFKFVILEECSESVLVAREQYHIDHSNKLLNICNNAAKLSDEARRKISKKLSGRKHSEDSKNKMSEAKKNVSEETREKISEAHKGKTITAETRQKLSVALKGREVSEKHRMNLSKSLKGRVISEEHRRKISEANKMYWQKRKSGEL